MSQGNYKKASAYGEALIVEKKRERKKRKTI
jgi:hypothetical protein